MTNYKIHYAGEDMNVEVTAEFSETSSNDSKEEVYISKHEIEDGKISLKIENVPETPSISENNLVKIFLDAYFMATNDAYKTFKKRADKNGLTLDEYLDVLLHQKESKRNEEVIIIPRTRLATQFITAKTKVANTLFQGSIEMNGTENIIGVEKRGAKNFIDTMVTVNFENMPNLYMSREISMYDRIVHDAVTSLSVAGGNEYITPLMIYRTMTGNPAAAPKKEQLEKVSESVQTLSRIRILIQAEEEKNRYGLEKATYEGNLLATEIVTGEHNGRTGQWIHLLRSPVLYDYSSQRIKQQVSRTDIKLLNSPINKNVEKIELQYYLLQRVETMKNSKTKTSNRILLQTIYDLLNVSAPNPKALSKKQTNIRDNAIIILDYWKKEKFIKGYKLIKQGRSVIAIDIEIK